jgi:hypothetical protein
MNIGAEPADKDIRTFDDSQVSNCYLSQTYLRCSEPFKQWVSVKFFQQWMPLLR